MLLRKAGVHFELTDRFYREIVLSMNGNKGRTGEFLVQASVLKLLRSNEDRRVKTMPVTQHVLYTPGGARRIDCYFAETRSPLKSNRAT
jgi:hypothetical protein